MPKFSAGRSSGLSRIKTEKPLARLRHAVAVMDILECRRLMSGVVNPWTAVAQPPADATHIPIFSSPDFQAYTLNTSALTNSLANAPAEDFSNFGLDRAATSNLIDVPTPDGGVEEFKIVQTQIMDPALAAKYPSIKTYSGVGVDDPLAVVALDYTPLGFHAQVFTPTGKGAFLVDPYFQRDQSVYASYYSNDAATSLVKPIPAEVASAAKVKSLVKAAVEPAAALTSGTELRTYRTAVAATSTYTKYFGGTVTDGLAGIVTSMNRIDELYESELSIRFKLVAHEDKLIYTAAASDPYSTTSLNDQLGQNQTIVDSVIGTANYDTGAVFSLVDQGGIASLGAVGTSDRKAEVAVGAPSPTGFYFDIELAAHEWGHSFSATHSNDSPNDGANVEPTTAYEPGSGSTIMSYAGVTGANSDLQELSAPYFLWASMNQILTYADSQIPTVGTRTPIGNHDPVVAGSGTYTIPANTPFALTAVGSDADGNPLTYSWEEGDLGPTRALNAPDNGSSPLFRVFNPSTSPTRYFPQIASILSGENKTDNTLSGGFSELLPTTARTMKFIVTARDDHGGTTVRLDAPTLVTSDPDIVNGKLVSFGVSDFNSAQSIAGGSTQTITWNVANTTSAAIGTSDVSILMSTDGGITFSKTLLASTPNDGSAAVLMPFNTGSTKVRFKVAAVGNIYFDINNANITLTKVASNAPVVTTNPANKTVTVGTNVTFTAAATGTPTPTVQWQVSTNGGATFANISGATSKTYSFVAAQSQTGNRYRAVFTNSVNSATTTAATLTVVETHPVVPAFSSRPGSAYTIYLDFAGFNYNGNWGDKTPGSTPAYDDVPANGTFNSTEIRDITKMWSIVAQAYSGFNINVTTVDPAIAAGQATSDAARQAYYGNTPNFVHTVFGSQIRNGTDWFNGNATGISNLGTAVGTDADSATGHTNWIFSESAMFGNDAGQVFELGNAASHEDGHALGLYHQGDYVGDTLINDYSDGERNADGTPASAAGTYNPVMTAPNFTGPQRIAWRVGDSNNGTATHIQNDVATILSTNTVSNAAAAGRTGAVDLHLVNDGIGRSIAAATPLALTGSSVNSSVAKGVIVPLSETAPNPIGAANYTTDYFSFYSNGTTTVSLTVNDGTSFLTPGVADNGATLQSKLSIYNSVGTLVGTGIEDASTLKETFSSLLGTGIYYAKVASFGGHAQVNLTHPEYNASNFYDMGAFFLTGSGFSTAPVTVAPVITTNPTNKNVTAGTNVTFTAAATGSPRPTVQWSLSADGGATYADIVGATNASLTVTPTTAGTFKYKVTFTNSAGSASTTATLTVTPVVTSFGSISGVLFNDTNANGVKDGSETVTGVRQVFIDTNGNGVLDSGERSTMSNAAGVYTFANVATGSTKVSRVFPTGYSLSNPSAGTNGKDVIVNVVANATATANLGTTNRKTPPLTGTITGTLWNDGNGDGIYDKSEPVTGVRTVFIDSNRNGILDANEQSTQSDAKGKYTFKMVPVGTVVISRVFPSGYTLSNPTPGTNGKDVLVTLTANSTVTVNLGTKRIIQN